MFFYADSWIPDGPPPSQVLESKWSWRVLIVLLLACFTIRIIVSDMAGAILSGLMLCFAIVMVRNRMQEVTRYACTYGVLCFLNFILDIIPLMSALDGRYTKTVEPVYSVDARGHTTTTHHVSEQYSPFFDHEQGVIYNLQSVVMLLSPLSMILGAYLATVAHVAFVRSGTGDQEEEAEDNQELPLPPGIRGAFQGIIDGRRPSGHFSSNRSAGANRQDFPGARTSRSPSSARDTFEKFHGNSYRL